MPAHPAPRVLVTDGGCVCILWCVGINVRLGVRVVGLTENTIQLKGGEELPYGCVVWSTGGRQQLAV